MDREDYIEMMMDMFYHNFDLNEEEEVAGEEFDLYAFCEVTNEKYLVTRSLKIYQYNDYEHCLVESRKSFSRGKIRDDFFQRCISELLEVESGHHQSYLTYVQVVSEPLSEEDIAFLENYKFATSFWLGIRGWCDLRLVAVDLSREQIYVNKEAERVKQIYQPQYIAEKMGYEQDY